MSTFKLSSHMDSGRRIIEVWHGDQFIAGIYPGGPDERSFKIVSHYALTATVEDSPKPARLLIDIGEREQ